jgi:hypothetical protein
MKSTFALILAMEDRVVYNDFGIARIKREGGPAHPEDVFIHCGCDKCEVRWQKQLKAYYEAFPPDPDDDDGGLEEVPEC